MNSSHNLFKTTTRRAAWAAVAMLANWMVPAAHAADSYSAARHAVVAGRADAAVAILQPMLASNPKDAQALNLLCRVHSAEEHDDAAIQECSAAVSADPDKGEYYRWLARAYGNKAGHSGVFAAMGAVKHVRDNFQQAAKLEPASADALSDLGEFYLEAPGAFGGGADKARALLPALTKADAARGHWLSARIAEVGDDDATAESEYKQVIATASSSAVSNGSGTSKAQGWADLAAFYQHKNRKDDAVNAVRSALDADPLHDGALASAAAVLYKMKQQPELAAKLFQLYLASPHKTEEEPAFQVYTTLGDLLLRTGDKTGAQKAFAAALALAHDYAPAQKGAGKAM